MKAACGTRRYLAAMDKAAARQGGVIGGAPGVIWESRIPQLRSA
jgi:hypothetical protein